MTMMMRIWMGENLKHFGTVQYASFQSGVSDLDLDLSISQTAPPPRAASPQAPQRCSSPTRAPRSSSPRAPPRTTTSRFCLDSSTLQQIESLVTSSPSPPRISQVFSILKTIIFDVILESGSNLHKIFSLCFLFPTSISRRLSLEV